MLQKYHVDTLRYYFCASTTYGLDVNFSESTLITMHNSELADIIGNLVGCRTVFLDFLAHGFVADIVIFPLLTYIGPSSFKLVCEVFKWIYS
jgi:hypothetical protein